MRFIRTTLVVIVVSLAASPAAQEAPAEDIERIIEQISQVATKTIVGWERISGGEQKISDTKAIREAIARSDWSKVAEIVHRETGYECLHGAGYVVFLPKDDAAVHDPSLTKRKVSYPTLQNTPSADFLEKIKSSDGGAHPVKFMAFERLVPMMAAGNVSVTGGESFGYEILSEMARQLKARTWAVSYMTVTETESQKQILPQRLLTGFVSFSPL